MSIEVKKPIILNDNAEIAELNKILLVEDKEIKEEKEENKKEEK